MCNLYSRLMVFFFFELKYDFRKGHNIDSTLRAVIGQRPMFYQNVKRRKSVFYCFSLHYIYIIEQTKKPKPYITL